MPFNKLSVAVCYITNVKKWNGMQTLKDASVMFLVRANEDLMGQQKLQMLQDHFSIKGRS